jgi:DNA-binding MarR family transcriptional regulator
MARDDPASPTATAPAGDPPDSGFPPRPAPFESVGFALSTLGFAVSARFHERLAPLGIEPRDFALLRAVGAAEGQSQQAVGERLRIPPSRMVSFVDALEARGLLERRPHPTDRRVRALHLTSDGQALHTEAFTVALGFERELCAGLDDEQRRQLLERLATVGAALGVPPGVHAANMQPGRPSPTIQT